MAFLSRSSFTGGILSMSFPDSKKLVVDMEQPWLGGKKKDYPHKLAELITDKLNQI